MTPSALISNSRSGKASSVACRRFWVDSSSVWWVCAACRAALTCATRRAISPNSSTAVAATNSQPLIMPIRDIRSGSRISQASTVSEPQIHRPANST
jgi:hypothetical protein